MMPTISLVMIVRNEEKVLGRCLAAVSPWVDQVIVVDTGSSDGTRAVAAAAGAQIHEFPWIDDFAAARNFASSCASGDWLLSLDADEELVDGSILRPLIADLEAKGIAAAALRMSDVDARGQLCNSFAVARLWRSGRGIRFVGRIHETLDLPSAPVLVPVRVRHYGYRDVSREQEQAKAERNLRLLELDLAERPEELRLAEHKLRCLEIGGKMEAAAEWAATLMLRHGVATLGAGAAFSCLSVLEQTGRLPVEGLETALETWPEDPDLCYLAAVVSLRLGRRDTAGQLLLLWLRLLQVRATEFESRRCLTLGRRPQVEDALRQLGLTLPGGSSASI